ncbi:MAG: DUF3617 family protein [Thermodesulfovibrionales bacterium]
MKRKEGLLLLVVLLVLGMTATGCSQKKEASAPVEKPVSASKGVDMQEGKWKITNTIEMQGMPAGMMKPQTITTTTCLSQQDYVPKDTAQKDCTMKDLKVDGNTVNWEILCKNSSGKGKITYAGSTFDGVMETMMKEGGKEMNAKMTMKGKYLGPCAQ